MEPPLELLLEPPLELLPDPPLELLLEVLPDPPLELLLEVLPEPLLELLELLPELPLEVVDAGLLEASVPLGVGFTLPPHPARPTVVSDRINAPSFSCAIKFDIIHPSAT